MELDIFDPNVEVLDDISQLEKYMTSDEECFVIGGATIYKLLMPYADKLYITRIHQDFEGDVYFPEISEDEWQEVNREPGLTNDENPFNYEYIDYIRK